MVDWIIVAPVAVSILHVVITLVTLDSISPLYLPCVIQVRSTFPFLQLSLTDIILAVIFPATWIVSKLNNFTYYYCYSLQMHSYFNFHSTHPSTLLILLLVLHIHTLLNIWLSDIKCYPFPDTNDYLNVRCFVCFFFH